MIKKIHLIISYLGVAGMLILSGTFWVFMSDDDEFDLPIIIASFFCLLWSIINIYFNFKTENRLALNEMASSDLLDIEVVKTEQTRFNGQIGVGVLIIISSLILLLADYNIYQELNQEMEYEDSFDYLFPVLIALLTYMGTATPVFVIWSWIKTKKNT